MSDRNRQQKKERQGTKVEDLTSGNTVPPQSAESIKGGLRRTGNDDDDDLEDLEIQR